jgi:hypothetical protein
MLKVSILNMQIESGWILRARKLDMKVTSSPGRFGDEIHIVKRDGVHIILKQNTQVRRILDVSSFNVAQLGIIDDLKICGLVGC